MAGIGSISSLNVPADVLPAPDHNASATSMPAARAVSLILSGESDQIAAGATSIKLIAAKDEGEASCVAAGACSAIAQQLGITNHPKCVSELCKATINTAVSQEGYAAHLQAGTASSLAAQLLKQDLPLDNVQLMCKAVHVLSNSRLEGQLALVDAGVAPALVKQLNSHTDSATLLRIGQAMCSLLASEESCKMAFIRADCARAIVPHLTITTGRDCLILFAACIARISTVVEAKHALLQANIAPAIISLINASDDAVCSLVVCAAARLACVDEADDILSKEGIAAAIIHRLAACKSPDLLAELSKLIGNIASNSHHNHQYCCIEIALPLSLALSSTGTPQHVLRQILRAMSAIASVEGQPSPKGQVTLIQCHAPVGITKLLHVCDDDQLVMECVRAMRFCALDCVEAQEQMQAFGAMQALSRHLEKQTDIKIAAEIYSAAQVILAGSQTLALAPAPVDSRSLLQKLFCYPNRIHVQPASGDHKWNIEAGLSSSHSRLASVREQARIFLQQPPPLCPDDMFKQWENVRETGIDVLSKSSAKVKLFGVLMSKKMREAAIYITLAVLVTLYAVLLLDSDSAYFLKRALQSQLEAEFPCNNVSNFAKTFYDINDANDIFMWLQGVVLPFIYSGSSNPRPQCFCQSEEFITCSGPHSSTNSDISSSKDVYTFNATTNSYVSSTVVVSKRGLPFLAEAVCSDEGAAGTAAASYAVVRVVPVASASRFYTLGIHFLRIGDPFHWVAHNASSFPSFISNHLGRTLYIFDADGSNSSTLSNWFEVSLSPRCVGPRCAATEHPTTALRFSAQPHVFSDSLTLHLDRPCLPESPCMSECGKRECQCNEAHGFSNVSQLLTMPSARVGPIGGSNILLQPPRLRNSVIKPSDKCVYPKRLLDGYSDGVCWSEFSAENVQTSGTLFVEAYTAAFGQPDAKALKWLQYTQPVGSTFLSSNADLLRFYGSGGFIMDIPLDDYEGARQLLHQAKTIGWWNRNSSRALSLELAFYNANVNRFITVQYILESPYSSGMIRGAQWRHSTLTPWSRPYNFAGLICQYAIFAMNPFIIAHLRVTYKQMGSERFWEDGFLVINVIVSTLLLVAFCISVYVLVETSRVVILDSSSMEHHVIFALLYWNAQVNNVFTVVSWLVWIRNVEFLDIFSPKTKILQKVIVRSFSDILIFSIVFVVYLMGFAISRMVAMGSTHSGFRSLNSALNFQLMEIFVSCDYTAFRDANPVMGPLYFVAFTLVIIMLMVNMLAAIVERFVGLCKEESDATAGTSEQDVADYSRRLLKTKLQQILKKKPGTLSECWLEMWAKEGSLFQNAGINSLEELISAADLNCDGSMSMEELLDFIKKNAEANEEAMYQVRVC
jgi:hypothetical protein